MFLSANFFAFLRILISFGNKICLLLTKLTYLPVSIETTSFTFFSYLVKGQDF